jgi:hypothetical protein
MSVTKVTDNLRDTTALDGTKVSGTIPVGSLFASGGKGADIASSATVVIGTDGSYFDITGTTGISTQFTVAAGRRFTLQFDGAVTITDNAAITLAGAANFTTAAGDILSFVAVAANTVVQTGYSLVDGGSPVAASSEATYVQFPATQVASADANRLDDYEEGTWTATSASNGGTLTVNTASDTCSYVKIGRSVHIQGTLTFSTASSPTGEITISGLPFTPEDLGESAEYGHIGSLIQGSNSEHEGMEFYNYGVASTLKGRRQGRTDDGSNCANLIDTGSTLRFGGTYYATD